ncbi:MAG TPA: hypothetical protein VI953_04285 [Candidatus Paceibacterota bacterium]
MAVENGKESEVKAEVRRLVQELEDAVSRHEREMEQGSSLGMEAAEEKVSEAREALLEAVDRIIG